MDALVSKRLHNIGAKSLIKLYFFGGTFSEMGHYYMKKKKNLTVKDVLRVLTLVFCFFFLHQS